MTINPEMTPEDRDFLAAEFALGLLAGEDRTGAMRLQLADADFSRAVEAWQRRFAPLSAAFHPADAPDGVWAAVAANIKRQSADATMARSTGFWRVATFASSAIAASLLLILLLRPDAPMPVQTQPIQQSPVPARDVIVAQLRSDSDAQLFAARYEADRGQIVIRTEAFAPGGGAPELWVIPADGTPRSLGLIDASGATMVPISPQLRAFIGEGSVLAVSIEDPLGAPHDAPAGPIIATGTVSRI